MKKNGITLIFISIAMLLFAASGFKYKFSTNFMSELAKYCFISWLFVAIAGYILISIAYKRESNKRN